MLLDKTSRRRPWKNKEMYAKTHSLKAQKEQDLNQQYMGNTDIQQTHYVIFGYQVIWCKDALEDSGLQESLSPVACLQIIFLAHQFGLNYILPWITF